MQRNHCLYVWMILFLCGVSHASAAEATTHADFLANFIPKENPYHPGETIACHRNLSDKEWPQLANTPQRTSYTPMKFDPPQGQKKWAVCLTDLDLGNRINATVQPIIAEGRVYVGCKNGKLFALDAKTGEVIWTFQADGPICHTAGYAKGRVMVAALDGCVYAVNAASGNPGWFGHNETSITSVVGENVMAIHVQDFYQAGGLYIGGAFDLAKRRWYVDVRGQQPAADSKGWELYGGDGNESGGSDAMSAADGLLYHSVKRKHIIVCYEPVP